MTVALTSSFNAFRRLASVAKSIYEVYFNEKIKQINPNYEFNKFISEIPADNKKNFR